MVNTNIERHCVPKRGHRDKPGDDNVIVIAVTKRLQLPEQRVAA